MKQKQTDEHRHIDSPSEADRDKHVNFLEPGQERSENSSINKATSRRQKQWQQEIEEGEREKRSNEQDNSSMPMDNEDTIGVP